MRLLVFQTSLLLFLLACNAAQPPVTDEPPASEPDTLKAQISRQQSEIDSLKKVTAAYKRPEEHIGPPPAAAPEASIRTGAHDLTLQWIGWDRPGKATIQQATKGRYSIKGEQRKGDDYLYIDGFLTPLTPEKVLFEGTLRYRVADLNGGAPCDKSGQQEFLSTKGRKYWRLQNMINCEGGLTTDYVDIYF